MLPTGVYYAEILFGKAHVSDVKLIQQARQGDDVAWSTLVGQHQTAIFRLAYLLLGRADEAEDVAQESLIRAFHALDSFDPTRPLRPWLLQITKNVARNRQRAMGRYLAAIRRWFQAEQPPAITVPADEAGPRWEAETLWQAIRRLRTDDQEIIYLRYFLELSVAETAETLQIAPGTVKSRLHRALSRLRQIIEVHFPALPEERLS